MNKKLSRQRRARRGRARIKDNLIHRLSVHRTPRHIYAQVLSPEGDQVLASASSVDKELREEIPNGGNISAAQTVGKVVAERAKLAGVGKVAFDRSGFKYHGRIKALADAARESGLEF